MLAISKTNFMEVYIQQVKGSGKNEDRLWLKCKASHFGFPHDLFYLHYTYSLYLQEKVCGIYLTMRLHCKKWTLS